LSDQCAWHSDWSDRHTNQPVVPDNPVLENSASNNLDYDKADVVDWRRPIIDYLEDPSHKVDRKVRQLAFKVTLVEGELYH
jgi:hypothetical protein